MIYKYALGALFNWLGARSSQRVSALVYKVFIGSVVVSLTIFSLLQLGIILQQYLSQQPDGVALQVLVFSLTAGAGLLALSAMFKIKPSEGPPVLTRATPLPPPPPIPVPRLAFSFSRGLRAGFLGRRQFTKLRTKQSL